ncbi:acyl-CoA dehydrogenase family member 11 [Trichonephila clavipes]|nr:acyl-CoA dehydrogenase family member 11 [Trichonephila clavipes]
MEWNDNVFTDESRFCLKHHDWIQVWRHRVYVALYPIHHIWHYRVRLRESGQPIGRLRKARNNAFPRTIPVSFIRLDTSIATESSLNVKREISDDLQCFGDRIVNEIDDLGWECELNLPSLENTDVWGRRTDELRTCHAWKKQHDISAEEGIVAIPYEQKLHLWSRLHQICKIYLYSPSAGLYTCPLAMTDGAAKTILSWRNSTARGGRVRSTTPAEDRYIVLSAKRNRRTTAQQVANQFLAASGKQISRKTVARHESRFSLSSDCRRQLIWRESGTAYRPENIQEKDRYPTCSIMVWAGIMINGRTRLHVVANGTMTGQRYIDEVLLPHVRLFRGAVGDKFVFMDDNATCHRTLAVQDCLDSEGIQRLVWPARSPDLNPIENVWDALGRQVAGRNYPSTNKNTLIRALTEEWDKLPQQLLDNVVQSMVRRVECCITLHGGHIPY